jgi:hypothetical protein
MPGETKKVKETIIPREAEVFREVVGPREANMAGDKASDAPLNSLMDSTANPKVKTTKGERIGTHSPTRNTLGVEVCVRAPGWD